MICVPFYTHILFGIKWKVSIQKTSRQPALQCLLQICLCAPIHRHHCFSKIWNLQLFILDGLIYIQTFAIYNKMLLCHKKTTSNCAWTVNSLKKKFKCAIRKWKFILFHCVMKKIKLKHDAIFCLGIKRKSAGKGLVKEHALY